MFLYFMGGNFILAKAFTPPLKPYQPTINSSSIDKIFLADIYPHII
jgi:hypothetical protein